MNVHEAKNLYVLKRNPRGYSEVSLIYTSREEAADEAAARTAKDSTYSYSVETLDEAIEALATKAYERGIEFGQSYTY
jgi:hypothetical protein